MTAPVHFSMSKPSFSTVKPTFGGGSPKAAQKEEIKQEEAKDRVELTRVSSKRQQVQPEESRDEAETIQALGASEDAASSSQTTTTVDPKNEPQSVDETRIQIESDSDDEQPIATPGSSQSTGQNRLLAHIRDTAALRHDIDSLVTTLLVGGGFALSSGLVGLVSCGTKDTACSHMNYISQALTTCAGLAGMSEAIILKRRRARNQRAAEAAHEV